MTTDFDYGKKLPDGQYERHPTLPGSPRWPKTFVRPIRRSYRHVGPRRPQNMRDLTPEEQARYVTMRYVKFEEYERDSSIIGRFWTQAELDRIGGCGVMTTMSQAIAETYAQSPEFYGKTYCAGCQDYFPVGASGEFVWDGTDEKVGT
jgi:hypothetical protein